LKRYYSGIRLDFRQAAKPMYEKSNDDVAIPRLPNITRIKRRLTKYFSTFINRSTLPLNHNHYTCRKRDPS